jgi:dTDP-4-dehydrorhamnose reductase
MKILITGGSGLFGTYFTKLYPDVVAPSHAQLDIMDVSSIASTLEKYQPDVVLHAAALTGPIRCDERSLDAMSINIVGTANIVKACAEKSIRLVYISTDYVFRGDRGNYGEDDELLPQNYYAWTKLGGECAVRAHKNALIIRTSFSPDEFPYPKAFVDQYTSRDALSVIAPMIHSLVLQKDLIGVVHVGTKRKSVKELALQLGKSDVADLRLSEVPFKAPADTSFDLTKLTNLLKK